MSFIKVLWTQQQSLYAIRLMLSKFDVTTLLHVKTDTATETTKNWASKIVSFCRSLPYQLSTHQTNLWLTNLETNYKLLRIKLINAIMWYIYLTSTNCCLLKATVHHNYNSLDKSQELYYWTYLPLFTEDIIKLYLTYMCLPLYLIRLSA